jgi:hypothetical protein
MIEDKKIATKRAVEDGEFNRALKALEDNQVTLRLTRLKRGLSLNDIPDHDPSYRSVNSYKEAPARYQQCLMPMHVVKAITR